MRDGSGGLAPGVCPALRITPPATPSAGSVTLGQAARLFCGFAWNKHAFAAVRRKCFTVCPDGQALHSRPLCSAPAGEGRGTKGGASHSQAAHYDPVPQRHPRPVRPGPLRLRHSGPAAGKRSPGQTHPFLLQGRPCGARHPQPPRGPGGRPGVLPPVKSGPGPLPGRAFLPPVQRTEARFRSCPVKSKLKRKTPVMRGSGWN